MQIGPNFNIGRGIGWILTVVFGAAIVWGVVYAAVLSALTGWYILCTPSVDGIGLFNLPMYVNRGSLYISASVIIFLIIVIAIVSHFRKEDEAKDKDEQ